RAHWDGRLDPAGQAVAFQDRLHRQRVHHGRQHAHIIRRGPVDAFRSACQAAEDIAAADHHADLGAGFDRFLHVGGDALDRAGVDAETTLAHQCLTRDLEQYTGIFGLGGHGVISCQRVPAIWATSSAKSLSTFSMPSPTWKRTKPSIATGALRSLAACSTTLLTWVSPSITEVWERRTVSS